MDRLIGSCISAVLLAGLSAGVAAKNKYQLNDTGYADCGSAGCAGSGMDGEFGRDATKRNNADGSLGFSFVKLCNSGATAGQGNCPANPVLGLGADQWGCTRDKVTGLVWEVKTADGGLRDWRKGYTAFIDARAGEQDVSVFVKAVNAAGLCGKHDWRLPLPLELHSLVDYARPYPGPMLGEAFFPNTLNSFYLTSTALSADPTYAAWGMSFFDGEIDYVVRNGPWAARLVRRDQPLPTAGRFVVDGGEAIDTLTGLIWRRCGESRRWSGTACVATNGPTRFTWRAALAHATSVAAETGQPWRLPNAKEQMSIVDHSGRYPRAINTRVFAVDAVNWTSTYQGSSSAWAVAWSFGDLSRQYDMDQNSVFLVRDAP